MTSEAFRDGLRHELANRAFAAISTRALATRCQGRPDGPFWSAYAELEQFNAPRYRRAARRWGMPVEPDGWTRLRGAAAGATPTFLLGPLLRYVHPKTVAYVEDLRRLRALGPPEGAAFLDYVVAQEEVQVAMMRLALAGRHQDVPALVADHVDRHRGVILL